MQTVGSVLRAERLRQGLTIDAISLETKISTARLQALEADELDRFSSPFLYKSFAKQVARRLRIEEKSIGQILDSQAASIPTPLVPGEEERKLPNVPALDNLAQRSGTRWLIPTISLVAVLAASSGVYEWREHSAAKPKGSASVSMRSAMNTVHTPSTSRAAAAAKPLLSKPGPAQAGQPRSSKAIEEPQIAASAAPAPSQVRLELAALENVWISVVSDGKFIFSGVLSQSESKSFSSHEVARIKVGNAGGVSVNYNGRKIGPLGARGSVCTAIFTATNFEIVEPQPHVELTQYISGNE
jgi:cytoskeleton protein RodZ